MLDWKIFTILVPLFFVVAQTLSKMIPKQISLPLMTAYEFFFGACIMLVIHLYTAQETSIFLSGKYIALAVLIGTLVTLGNFFIFTAYSFGAPQSLFNSIASPLLIICSVLFGYFLWHERLHPAQLIGIFFSVIGIVLLVFFRK